MAWPPFFLHRTTLSLILFVEIVAANSLIVPTANSVSLRPYDRDRHSAQNGLTPLIVQQLEQSSPNAQFPVTNWNSFTPPQRGVPGRREGGGTRGCAMITPLIPDPDFVMARTISPQPIFFFHISNRVTDEPVNFQLTDEQGNKVYEKKFKLTTQQGGIVGIKLLSEAETPPLEDNQKYEWSLVLCDVIERGGWIQRVSLTSVQERQLKQLTDPVQRLNFYAKQGLWFEAIATLAALRSTYSNDSSIQNQWIELLKSVGFDPETAQELNNEKQRETEILQAPMIESQLSISTEVN